MGAVQQMIKIGICDDEKIILEILQQMIMECLEELDFQAEIILFSKGKDLLETEMKLDILFLDIEMPQIDGIEVGKKLRRKGNECKIVVATSRQERFKEAFYINAFRFVTKPFEIEEVREALEEAIIALGGVEKIQVYKEWKKCDILQRDILYIEAMDSSVEFITKEGIYRKEISLTKLEKEFKEKGFFRINRQCIVNMAQIEKYERGTVLINNDNKSVSQRRKKEFCLAYREYLAWK